MICVLKYGSGNVAAITNIFNKLGVPHSVAECKEELSVASKIVLPGVGAFDQSMQLLERSGMIPTLNELVMMQKKPVLGVCVGMQMMALGSEEGDLPGLSWIQADVVRMDTTRLVRKPRLPHMGWNAIVSRKQHSVLDSIDLQKGFYFLHSYHIRCRCDADVLTTSEYGGTFTSSFVCDNVFGFQFHPEKSHKNGIQLFQNFAEL